MRRTSDLPDHFAQRAFNGSQSVMICWCRRPPEHFPTGRREAKLAGCDSEHQCGQETEVLLCVAVQLATSFLWAHDGSSTSRCMYILTGCAVEVSLSGDVLKTAYLSDCCGLGDRRVAPAAAPLGVLE